MKASTMVGAIAILTFVGAVAAKHSANTPVVAVPTVATPVTAANGNPVLPPPVARIAARDDRMAVSWTRREKKDPLSDEVSVELIGDAFRDGVGIQAEAGCDQVGFEMQFSVFRGDTPLDLAGTGDNVLGRIRYDGKETTPVRGGRPYTNSMTIIFYDPVRLRAMQEAPAKANASRSGQSAMIETFVGSAYAALASAIIEHKAAGTVLDFASAKRIGLGLPLATGGEAVLDLNPLSPELRRYVADCIR